MVNMAGFTASVPAFLLAFLALFVFWTLVVDIVVRNLVTPPGTSALIQDRQTVSGKTAAGDTQVKPDSRSLSLWRQRQDSCVLRFICEIHIQEQPDLHAAADMEKNIVRVLQKFHLEAPDSPAYKYTFASHMGQLLRGSAPFSCHELYPSCPFSRKDMLLLLWSLENVGNVS